MLGSPRLELLENGFGLGQFQPEVRTDGSVQITRERVIISSGRLECFPGGVDRPKPHRPIYSPDRLSRPLPSDAT
jgi:hypothetical protein